MVAKKPNIGNFVVLFPSKEIHDTDCRDVTKAVAEGQIKIGDYDLDAPITDLDAPITSGIWNFQDVDIETVIADLVVMAPVNDYDDPGKQYITMPCATNAARSARERRRFKKAQIESSAASSYKFKFVQTLAVGEQLCPQFNLEDPVERKAARKKDSIPAILSGNPRVVQWFIPEVGYDTWPGIIAEAPYASKIVLRRFALAGVTEVRLTDGDTPTSLDHYYVGELLGLKPTRY